MVPHQTTPGAPHVRRYVAALLLTTIVCLAAEAEPPAPTAKATTQPEDPVVISPATTNAHGLLSHTVSSPYQYGPNEVEVLLPSRLVKGKRYRVLYILPVQAGITGRWGSGVAEAKRLGLHDKHHLICVAPAFDRLPWFADHPTDRRIRQETYILKVLLGMIESRYPVVPGREGRLLVGFSKSGWGAWSLALRHPKLFAAAAAWDAPLAMARPSHYGMGPIFGTQANFEKYRITALLARAAKRKTPLPRLILLGYGGFRQQMQKVHELMQQLQIPHVYANEARRQHDWRSGWLAGAVEMLCAEE